MTWWWWHVNTTMTQSMWNHRMIMIVCHVSCLSSNSFYDHFQHHICGMLTIIFMIFCNYLLYNYLHDLISHGIIIWFDGSSTIIFTRNSGSIAHDIEESFLSWMFTFIVNDYSADSAPPITHNTSCPLSLLLRSRGSNLVMIIKYDTRFHRLISKPYLHARFYWLTCNHFLYYNISTHMVLLDNLKPL